LADSNALHRHHRIGGPGIAIAVGALWGYRAIKEEAANIAERRAKEKIAEYLDSQAIRDRLKEEVKARVEEEANTLYRDFAIGFAFFPRTETPPSEEGRVGDQYPGSDLR
jgi:hypothetical protein